VLLTPVPREPLQLLTHVLDQPGPFTPGFLIASFPPRRIPFTKGEKVSILIGLEPALGLALPGVGPPGLN